MTQRTLGQLIRWLLWTCTLTSTSTQAVFQEECPWFCVTSANSFMLGAAPAANETSAAQRRQRRLRQFLRHERPTVAMLLAQRDHHTAPQGQKQARSGRWVRDELHGHDPEEPTPQLELFELFDEEPGGSRPDCLAGVRPQERVQRHTVEQIDDSAPCRLSMFLCR